MATVVSGTNRLMTSDREAHLADSVLSALRGPRGVFLVSTQDGSSFELPPEIGRLLQSVLESVSAGGSVTVTSIPGELTSSTAAAVLGVSRPTIMKLAKDGVLPSHKVGSHTRFLAVDVLRERKERRQREREAFAELMALEGDDL